MRSTSNDHEGDRGADAPRESGDARPPAPRAVPLHGIELRADAYRDLAFRRRFAGRTLALETFGRFLSLLKRRTFEGQAKYLYASAGGLNPIQTYVYVKKDAVSGLREGVYYYHPLRHSLHMLADYARMPASVFSEYDRECFESSGFAVFLVAQLNAIWPIYKSASSRLAVLEAGYMAQLLISRQTELNLGLSPMRGVNFEEIRPYFALDDGHRFVHGLFGGPAAETETQPVATDNVPACLRRSGRDLHERGAPAAYRNAFASMLATDSPALVPPTIEDKDEAKRHPAYLREIPDDAPSIELEELPIDDAYYPLRSTKREYADEPVALRKVGEFLSLLRPAQHGAPAAKLYASPSGTDPLKVYVYVKDDGVEGVAAGLYRYDGAAHELVLVNETLSCDFKTCHMPFNRKQVQASKFCVFLVASIEHLEGAYGDEAHYFGLLEAGYAGQLLLDRQAEFGIGVCPIGGLRFERIRDDFELAPRDELVHSFVCGGYELALPGDWKLLKIESRQAVKPSGPGAGTGSGSSGRKRQDVAIVGISGRYPGADNPERLWPILRDGKSCFREISFDDARDYRSARGSRAGAPAFRHRGGFLDEVDCFDSLLFNIPPVSAREMDPQERLVLEVVWECLENAGYRGAELAEARGRVGVFVGAMWDDYQHHSTEGWKTNRRPMASSQHASIANRISYFFDFTGPSVSLNTSCSSAMTALHYACESVRTGECQAAIVGGVNVLTHPYHYELLSSMDLLSSDSRPHPFGRDGSGWVPGEGVGAVLLKPLEEAEASRDHIYGVIKGTALGHSGKSARWTSPNVRRQTESIQSALENAGVDASSISYIEAAAPGAKLADASEIAALTHVFATAAREERTVHVGSVKGNIGHLESASALAQLTKVLLQMKHRALCPVPDLGTLNPLIQLEGSALEIVAEARPWSCGPREQEAPAEPLPSPRRALINAFGATGSGGHVIVEEYPASAGPACGGVRDEAAECAPALLLFSAATEEQVTRLVKRFDDFLSAPTSSLPRLDDIAHTLRVGRTEMAERLAVIARSHDELREKLCAYAVGANDIPNLFRGRAAQRPIGEADSRGLELTEIARRWVDGTGFDWQELVRGTERRVPLPTYPFAKHRYWICADSDEAADAAASGPRQAARHAAESTAEETSAAPSSADALAPQVEAYLKSVFAIVTEIPYETIDSAATLDSYGISSQLITQLNAWLSQDFRALSKTLFFEYRTIGELAQYFVRERAREVRDVLERASGTPHAAAKEKPARPPVEKRREPRARAERGRTKSAMAIVGVSGVYPRADTLEAFWRNLEQGVDCVSEIPEQRWDYREYYEEDRTRPGRMASKWGGFIDGVDLFDPLFFNITPKEAELMDPQERLFLQTVWHAFEDAGYGSASRRSAFDRKVGVFVGVMYAEYQLLSASDDGESHGVVVSSTYGSIANRISHFFDFSGPSLAVDTLCSSSLTALHLAVKSIERGECRAAIVGGVNLSIHPNKYIAHTQLNMPSSGGRCRSFGEGGDGFVPGEGVGAVLVKPLATAIEDGDRVYAVITGTAINHNGRTHGYTVPSPNAQAEMIANALEESGVDPESISYVEAHGTGTALGDPIEISGLTKAFQTHTRKTGFCSIGSVKSNIGHLESAAGIAGLTKILLQMKHRRLVPSLHSETLNPNIDFATTPFYVQQEAAEWARPTCEVDGQRVEYPRIACISSFGACGANAHAIVEEFVDEGGRAEAAVESEGPVAVVLSARSEERLRAYARKLLVFLRGRAERGEEVRLADLGYTLQVGREALEERLGVLVESVEELERKLAAYVEGEEPEGLYQGQVKRNREAMSVFTADEDMAQAIESWIEKRKLGQLLELWVKGLDVEWERLYAESKPRRTSAPTYPFAEERYWVQTPPRGASSAAVESRAHLHPLLQENTSDLKEQRFSSSFRGDEWFVAGEGDERVLPEAAQLTMAVEAVKRSSAAYAEGGGIKLEGVVWGEPIVAGAAGPVHIGLYAREGERIAFEVYSESEAEPRVHSQGLAAVIGVEQAVVDLAKVRDRLESRGAVAGARGLEELYAGSGEALAKLSLPVSGAGTGAPFSLPPGLLEAVLRISAGLGVDEPAEGSQGVTAARLDSVEIVRACPESTWAWIRRCDARPAAHGGKLDVDLCDPEGNVCARVRAIACRSPGAAAHDDYTVETMIVERIWRRAAAAREGLPRPGAHRVFLCGVGPKSEDLQALCDATVVELDDVGADLDGRFAAASLRLFEEIKSVLAARPAAPVLFQVVVPVAGPASILSGLSALLKTASLENPKIVGQVVAVEDGETVPSLIEKLTENAASPDDQEIRYIKGERLVAAFRRAPRLGASQRLPWKEGGVYLITGGVGGLGGVFADEIARRIASAVLIFAGRSDLTESKQAKLAELERAGAKVAYRSVDVTDEKAVKALVGEVLDAHGRLDGILHCAGVVNDNFILKKNREEFSRVLGPKVRGVLNLDSATTGLDLDFFVLFSSITGVTGNIGQADYSVANAFMDAFARYRESSQAGRRRKTLSIDWPLWRDGGMEIDEAAERAMTESRGLIAMDTAAGIEAFYRSLTHGAPQLIVMHGIAGKIERTLLADPVAKKDAPKPASVSAVDEQVLREKTLLELKTLFARITKLPLARIDAEEPLESYGIDSIMINRLNEGLGRVYGEISKTLFFEYQTLRALTEYLAANHREECVSWVRLRNEPAAPAAAARERKFERDYPKLASLRGTQARRERRPGSAESNGMQEPIAVIGLSGRYPQAPNLDAFWQNLRAGKDCVSEVPEDRWPLEHFFHADKERALALGKSYGKWGGFLERFSEFDPLFFNLSPREAITIDPQERLFLQACWEVLEDAGYTKETIASRHAGKVGVFAGVTKTGFELYGPDYWRQGQPVFPHTSFSSIANRVSYVLNLRGPSMPVDTMCSSSLTAIHEACERLRNDSCEMAIAGGVNLYLHPSTYAGICAQQMMSDDGKCRSFGAGANGYVPGEGVGAVLLKTLSKALADGDRIYGVIRGTHVNHGGKTNGYTVPNPNAQSALVREALDKAGIHAREVSYIEAHGTGTELGDPIEITGLTQAFRKDTADTGFCAIGSVKSNLGHLEAAAGIASVTKVLLQLRHGELVPSLHADRLNPNIDFSATPFVVSRELEAWRKPAVDGRERPRIAGISSFGAGGSNAHVLIEEFVDEGGRAEAAVESEGPVAVVLSARSEERLRAYARKLLVFLRGRAERGEEVRLADLGYTLQVGREALEERLGVLVESVEELERKLAAYVEGEEPEGLYQGQVKRNREAMSVFTADEDMAQAIESWIEKRKLGQLLELWVKGLDVEWERLYAESKPRRTSAPTYPFAEERYWVQTPPRGASSAAVESRAHLHPLLQENTSDLKEQRFSSSFRGDEWFVAGEGDERVLPEAAQLTMAVEAVKRSSAAYAEGGGIKLEGVVWGEPIVAGAAGPVHIGLYAREGERIAFEVYSESEAEPRVHSQGLAAVIGVEQAVVDLAKVRDRLESRGAVAGARGLEELYAGSGEALAKLSLPVSGAGTGAPFSLPPGLLEAVLRISAGLGVDEPAEGSQGVTAARLDSVEIVRACPESTWAWIRRCDARPAAHGGKLDVDLCDPEGNVCARVRGFEIHFVGAQPADAVSGSERKTVYLRKAWSVDDESRAARPPAAQPVPKMFILATKETKPLADSLAELSPGSTVIDVAQIDSHSASNEYRCCVDLVGCGKERHESLRWIESIQRLVERDRKNGVTLLGVTRALEPFLNHAVNLSGASRAGLYRMLQSEYGHVCSRHVDVDAALCDSELVAVIARELSMQSDDCEVCYRDGKRYRAELAEIPEVGSLSPEAAFPRDRVLLITGGTRGLGYLCAQHFVKRHGAKRLVLTGREPLPPRDSWHEPDAAARTTPDSAALKMRAVRALEKLGAEVRVLSTPLTDEAALRADFEAIAETFGRIGGVIHCAGVVDRQNPAFIRKTQDGIAAVLEPKVAGLDNLLAQLRGEPLEFVVLFSSVSATVPTLSSGQSDYAMANAYMDYVAEARTCDVPVTSVQWPSWKDTGMGEVTSVAYRNTGLLSHTDEEGLCLLERVLRANMGPTVLPAVIDPQRWRADRLMRRTIRATAEPPAVPSTTPAAAGTAAPALTARPPVDAVEGWLTDLFSTELRIDKQQLEKDARFEDYGLDSILLAQVSRRINEKLALPLDPSVLYEYATIESLAAWFVEKSPSSLPAELAPRASARPEASKPVAISSRRPALGPVAKSSRVERPSSEDIAVVGMSCRFPGADDLDEYWRLLADGRSAIARVPTRRFGASASFYAGLVRDVSCFDPSFFLISDDDAAVMDPQALLILEESLRAFAHAGYSLAEVKSSRTGVYVGARSLNPQFDAALEKSRNPIKALGQNYLAANVSQFFDLCGPSMVIDTACSSALVGMDLGIKGLLSGEIDAALVGGVSLLTGDGVHRLFQRRGLLNPHGEFHVFDRRASGVVLGEGAGVVLLKTLAQARKDRDRVYAVVKALALNNDGRTAGPATPKIAAQREVMKAALAKSGKAPADVVYIDANGSGSEVTDLLELKAIESVYRADGTSVCGLGSMKPNIGHPLTAEGIASFIKVVLMLSRGEWVPFLSATQAMTHYDLDGSPFRFCRERTPWPAGSRTAALNCFADGGTNAHVILEAHEPAPGEPPATRAPLAPPALDKRNCYAADVEDDGLPIRNWWAEGGRRRTETVVLN